MNKFQEFKADTSYFYSCGEVTLMLVACWIIKFNPPLEQMICDDCVNKSEIFKTRHNIIIAINGQQVCVMVNKTKSDNSCCFWEP